MLCCLIKPKYRVISKPSHDEKYQIQTRCFLLWWCDVTYTTRRDLPWHIGEGATTTRPYTFKTTQEAEEFIVRILTDIQYTTT